MWERILEDPILKTMLVLAWPVIFTFISLGIGFQMAGSTLMAQYAGDRAGTQVFSFLFLLSCSVAAAGHLAAPVILRLMGTPADVYPLAVF